MNDDVQETIHSAKLEACLRLLLDAQTDAELADARRKVGEIMAMDPERHARAGDFLQFVK